MKGRFLIKVLLPIFALFCLLSNCSQSNKKDKILKPILDKSPYYHYNMGNRYLNERKLELAIIEYLQAVELAPNNPDIHNFLGLAYFFNKQYPEAIGTLEKVLQIDPNYSDAHNNLGMVYNEIGNQSKAIEEFRLALQNPNYLHRERAYYNLGNIALNQENYDEAIFCFSKAAETEPSMADAYYRLGMAFEKIGRVDQALENYQQAIKLQPINLEANYNIALLYFKLNKDEKAKDYFYQVVTLAPDTELGQKAAEFIKIINKRLNKSE